MGGLLAETLAEYVGMARPILIQVARSVRLTRLMSTVFLALVFLLLFQNHAFAQGNGSIIRVGIFQNHPIVFIDDNGVPQGLYIDLLREIANEEGWDVQFVPGTWTEGLERLRSNEIDLMTSIAYLDEREVYMDFSHENVLTMWGQVYVHEDSNIQNIIDLQGGTVAILNGGINGINFMDMVNKFDIQCEFRVVGAYAEVAELVASGDVAAGVINNVHGYEQEKQYAIRRSPIIFNPFSLLFAVPEGKNSHLLETIDSYLAKWKSDPESPYYSITAKWLGQEGKEALPSWVFRALLYGGVTLAVVAVWVFVLRRQVKIRTKELTKSTEVLRESEEKYRTLTENVNLGIYRGSPGAKGKFIEVNPALVKMFGYKNRKELLPMSVADLYQNPKDREKFSEKMTDEGFASGEELQLKKKDGTPLIGSVSAVAIKDEKGKVQYFDGIIEDITERKQAEKELLKHREHLEELVEERTSDLKARTTELEQANIRLQEMDRLKSIFLNSMSHELRTPLNSIIGFIGIILQGMSGEISEEQRKQLTMVKNSANHLLGLINDILDISKIESGRVELSLEEFNLDDLVREVVESLSPTASEKGLELMTEVPEGITLTSDRRRVKRALMNLVSNAVKFTDQGSVKITAGVTGGDNLEVRVIDTGVGIKKEDMNKLFQPFQQIDISLAKKHEGTGLGLYLTKKLTGLLGGDISAKSEYGRGSEFTFTIPLRYKEGN